MASGPIVGEGDGTREKQRYSESKVYTRKAFKGPKKNLNNAKTNSTTTTALAAPTSTATVTAAAANHEKSNGEKKDEDNRNNKNDNSTQAPAEVIGLEDGNSAQPPAPVSEDGNSAQPPSEDGHSTLLPQQPQSVLRVEAASDDSSSLNRQEPAVVVVVAAPATQDTPAENGVSKPEDSRVKINLASRSKQEVRELRRKLESELDMVRGLVKKIETKQGQIGGISYPHVSANDGINNNVMLRRVHSEVASGGIPREATRPLHQLSISVLENSQGGIDNVEKEKRTPKANQFYQSSEFLLAKDKFPPAESNKKTKLNLKKQQSGGELGHRYSMGTKFFKSCSSLLEKLMKHKHSWVFNEPVDAEKLGLHDYHIIIKSPMDLGTIKSRLIKNWYKSPKEFAEDVRLTFDNAMTYNPPGQDVHVMAEQLAKIFEERWAIIESDYNREIRFGYDYGTGLPTQPIPRKAPPPPPALDMRRVLDRSESISHHGDPRPKPMTITPRTPAPKKPKAKDPHKRDMTYEEKQKLSTSLQGLPSEKLDTIVQIIRKRNSAVFQHDDEIEVDIDSVDAETLWELDRYVTNYKKSLSKHKRKAELAMQARTETEQSVLPQAQAPSVDEVPKETTTDPKIVSSSTPIQRDNQGDNRSRSSSSSSSSSDSGSSSSDSDSDSSSDSGSDAGSPRT
ncbi:transcription factor GTE4-like [Rosa sericea]